MRHRTALAALALSTAALLAATAAPAPAAPQQSTAPQQSAAPPGARADDPGTAPDSDGAPDSTADSAPGEVTGLDGLAAYRHQPVTWATCADPGLAASGTECATLKVPLDYRAPRGRTLDLAISRIRASDPAERRGILQTNPGGPGSRGLDMPTALLARAAPEVAAAYDVIGMDTRGTGASGALDCGLERGSWLRSVGTDQSGFEESRRLAKNDADACWAKYPDLLPHLTTRNIARDVDLVRAALGERRTSWFGQSYGSLLGAVYAQMFPGRVDRLVLDSAPDPARYGILMFQDMGPAHERALDDFAAWAAPHHREYGLGATPAAVRATVENLVRRAEAAPIAVDGFQVDGRLLPVLLTVCQGDDRDGADYAAVLRQLLDAADGKPVQVTPGLHELLTVVFQPRSVGADLDLASAMAVLCDDVAMPRDPQWYRAAVERSRASQPVFGPVYNGPTPCAFWPQAPRETPVEVDNAVPALQIQSTGDTHTTYPEALAMHTRLHGSRLVTVPGRTHGLYLGGYSPCAQQAVDAYLVTGALPAADTTCPR
ncbi:alpha/beta hydrolase [Kitasatospora sp. NPDC101176]|uniref:alpha/beta hydrolase n=1 Tax=Kitasatospora sp. NPDC101176 TaxID=3364099 RepID=UPI00381E1C1F